MSPTWLARPGRPSAAPRATRSNSTRAPSPNGTRPSCSRAGRSGSRTTPAGMGQYSTASGWSRLSRPVQRARTWRTAPLAVGDSIELGVVKLEVGRIDVGRGARLSLDVHPYAARLAGRTDGVAGVHSESACGADAESDASEPRAHASARRNSTAEHEPQPFIFSYKDRAAARRQLQSASRRCCTMRRGVPASEHVALRCNTGCNLLRCVATCCAALQSAALRCNTLHCVGTRCTSLGHVITRYATLRCNVLRSALQRVCNTSLYVRAASQARCVPLRFVSALRRAGSGTHSPLSPAVLPSGRSRLVPVGADCAFAAAPRSCARRPSRCARSPHAVRS